MAMASVSGGLFHTGSPTSTQVTAAPRPDAGPLSLASVTGGGSGKAGSGLDTVSGLQGGMRIAGTLAAGTEQVVASQTQQGGNLVLHLSDGSTITLVGMTHIDASFIH
jgi:hypothetical protein